MNSCGFVSERKILSLRSLYRLTLFVLMLVGSIIPLSKAQAGQGWSCPGISAQAEINLSPVLGETRLYRTKDVEDLTRMKNPDGGAVRQGIHVNGLGGGRIGLEGQALFMLTQRGDQACIRLNGVNAKFFAFPTIHIANNFPKGTCEYNAVLEHEKKHIRTLQAFHREFTPKFKTALYRIAGEIDAQGPFPAQNAASVQKDMNARINAGIEAFNKSIMPILEARQNTIDNPSEYARVEAQCTNWDKYVH